MTQITFDFSGKTVLVTGASRGIGLGVARGFARAGADLHIVGAGEGVFETEQMLQAQAGGQVTAHRCDITDRQGVRDMVGAIPRIDVLVNNAGFEQPTPMLEAGEEVEERFRRIIDTNVMGTYFVTREALPRMPAGARIIITSSIWGQTAVAGFSAYCASKHANIGFMRSLAQELGPRGINVNAVCPGWVKTDAAMHSLRRMSQERGVDEARLLDEILEGQALGGLMEPDDMASTYLFLASDGAANITGQTLNVDRGEVMG
ncbi:SDR family NAD(P)-dependent oxidoreductase [Marinobacterium aestuariivivens]|uniref:SDR family NAD(P)-dependent oxidoreductase n=1 Tax=Marinobacterium aestuariivivens TaxID=1698799 RepID=A0ABW1ZVP2_9GAMM